jgi:hypothetical protein
MSQRVGDGPIEPKLHDMMNALARGVDEILNGKGGTKKNGFVMLVFPFDGHEGRCNYISNAERKDIVVLLKEQLARFEGAPDVQGRA